MLTAISLPQNNKLFKSAQHYAQKFQWAVLPIHAVKDGRCTCGKPDCSSPGKHPLTVHGVKDASRDPAVIAAWWRRWPFANIGVATGAVSGFFVLDIDGEAGAESLDTLEAQHGKLPNTVEAITGGEGWHVLFRHTEGLVLKNMVALAPGLDIRGDNGYVLVAPSLHASGRLYHWEASSRPGEVELAAAPPWLLAMIQPQRDDSKTAKPSSEWRRLACTDALKGERNDRLTKIVGHLLRRYVDPFLAAELVQVWNRAHCKPPLPDAEVSQICDSIAAAELKRIGGERDVG